MSGLVVIPCLPVGRAEVAEDMKEIQEEIEWLENALYERLKV